MKRKSLKSGFLTLALAIVLIAVVHYLGVGGFDPLEGRARVSDGDSFRLAERRVRLIGLDAPELAQVCTAEGREVPCGTMARNALRALIAHRVLTCEPEGEDRYGRLLARCFLGDKDIGAEIVRSGWAVADGDYAWAEAQARGEGAGIWSMQFTEPSEWRLERNGETYGGFWSWFRD